MQFDINLSILVGLPLGSRLDKNLMEIGSDHFVTQIQPRDAQPIRMDKSRRRVQIAPL